MTVTVLVMTYNHRRFIAPALESVLIQQVDFPYEIIISEDCSTDGTRDIVSEYQNKYPDRIRLLLSAKNVRSNEIVARGIRSAQGRYVALLDGDDYWLSPQKLQKQVDFLERHPECSLCFHNARVVHEDGSREDKLWTPPNQPLISTLEDIWMGNFIPTCATMFRREPLGDIPSWYIPMFPITDWPLHILNAERGQIGYIDEAMGVYRYHSGGLYSPLSEEKKQMETLKFYQTMNVNFKQKYDRMIRVAWSKYFFEWSEEYVNRGERKQARRCFKIYLTGRPINQYISRKRFLRMLLKIYLPFI